MMDYKEFGQFFTKKGVFSTLIFKKNVEYVKLLKEKTSFLDENASYVERIYVYLNNITEKVKCLNCSNVTKYVGFTQGYREFCSSKCSNNSQKTIDKKKQTTFKNYGVESPSQNKGIREKTKQTNIERYGVESPSQFKEFKEKVKQTNIERYGVECVFQSEDVREKGRKTNLERYGVENVSQSEEIKEKIRKTVLEKFGVENASQSVYVREKNKKTILERYGVENVAQFKEFREKAKQTNLERYGVEHPVQSEDIKEKIRKTTIERYGVDNASQSEEIKKHKKNSSFEKYGVEHPVQSEDVKEKIKQSNLEKYGVECTLQSEEIKEKIKKTNIERYGVENPLQSEDVKEKIKQSNLEKYGVENPLQSEDVKEKIKQSNLEKYGVEHVLQNVDVKEKIKQSNLEKYGVENASQKHNPDSFKLLENKKWLEKEYQVKSSVKIAEELGVGQPVVSNYIINHGLKSNRWTNSVSYQESEVLNFIKSIYDGELILNSREILKPKEIDIYLPEKKIAIEFNGIHWHSTKYKDKFYHLNKTLECESQGIQLLQIFENEWIEKQDIWKSVLRTKLGLISTKIYGRKCVIKEVSNPEGKLFFENNHLQGGLNKGKHLGLYFDDQLVACISYGTSRFERNVQEIYRFASLLNTSVIGGFSKLMKQVPKPIVSYANRRWSNGNVYAKNGFEFLAETEPNYQYYKNSKVYSRQKFMKHKLEGLVGTGLLEFYDEEFTESEIMELNGFEKIYDCGNLKYILN
jgi:virulence-associated protein VapD